MGDVRDGAERFGAPKAGHVLVIVSFVMVLECEHCGSGEQEC
jgi:hypothetical protein